MIGKTTGKATEIGVHVVPNIRNIAIVVVGKMPGSSHNVTCFKNGRANDAALKQVPTGH